MNNPVDDGEVVVIIGILGTIETGKRLVGVRPIA
jgi:hypothetical protein